MLVLVHVHTPRHMHDFVVVRFWASAVPLQSMRLNVQPGHIFLNNSRSNSMKFSLDSLNIVYSLWINLRALMVDSGFSNRYLMHSATKHASLWYSAALCMTLLLFKNYNKQQCHNAADYTKKRHALLLCMYHFVIFATDTDLQTVHDNWHLLLGLFLLVSIGTKRQHGKQNMLFDDGCICNHY